MKVSRRSFLKGISSLGVGLILHPKNVMEDSYENEDAVEKSEEVTDVSYPESLGFAEDLEVIPITLSTRICVTGWMSYIPVWED